MKVIVNEGNVRLDVFLQNEIKDVTRSHVQKMIDDSLVKVNGKVVTKCGYKVCAGDEVEYTNLPEKKLDLSPEDIDIDIVYEDDDLVVINKPQGLVVHPACGNENHTLVNALLYHIKNLSTINGVVRPGIVHRLDKNTSGLLIIAKNDFAHVNLSKQIQEKSCKRCYIALCDGTFKEDYGTITTDIARSKKDRKKMAVCPDGEGKIAITNYKVLKRYNGYTLVEFDLKTGRTHQIRVHASYIHHPVVGDEVYGKKSKFNLSGQLLHAYKIEFTQPTTKKRITLTCDLPDYFKNVLEILEKQKN